MAGKTDKVAMIVATLFLARELAHRAHLKTRSYAAHSALGDFYPAAGGLADKLTEAWQGQNEELLDIPLASQEDGMTITDTLAGQWAWIDRERTAAFGDNSVLQNIVDEIGALYASTLYKLRFLS